MHRGRILETGATAALFRAPAHPYTRALLSAVPIPDPDAQRKRIDWDSSGVDLRTPLRQIEEEHWAAI
jgi:oligopeptide/dipeptide ABC transporter ATP-binding protein